MCLQMGSGRMNAMNEAARTLGGVVPEEVAGLNIADLADKSLTSEPDGDGTVLQAGLGWNATAPGMAES